MSKTALSDELMVLSVIDDHTGVQSPDSLPAHIVRTDSEAIAIASQLAASFKSDAALRDRSRFLPDYVLDSFSQSGLWAITVPHHYGGADVSLMTLAEVFAVIAEADPALAQIPHNHFTDIDTIRWAGTETQKLFFFAEALKGRRFGNAFAELNSNDHRTFNTRLTNVNGRLLLNGRKFYATGALMADWVQVGAVDDDGNNVLVFVRRHTPGLAVIDDWSGFGQRTTASGTVILDNVLVESHNVIQSHLAVTHPTTNGALSQLIHAAIDLGISRAAINETIDFVTTQSRPWADAHVDRASEDPLTIAQVGDLEYRLHSAEAMVDRGARAVEAAAASPDADSVASASIAVAEAKIATTELAILSTNKLFELAGTKSTLEKFSLDRHWRNARTHTLHDPVRWKYHAIGNYYLNHVLPVRHGWI